MSRTNSRSDEITYPKEHAARVEAVPTEELDLIHFIIGHGILKRDLR